ncbi:HD domain-containing protein [Enteractinococcus fodinae]|uniref:HD domain-containing protein n=1 Tax=Enteractinococcus fodinae TaxID=684663 RepID=A0ABU2B4B1_9MICC|nr:HD domain-containing protein [Enteractinococcus fodinae]MDR7348452.1 hypothetical protein [Enteractinococcus fodinae]
MRQILLSSLRAPPVIVCAYARRLCDAYLQADRELVLIATLLHDTGWAHVDEERIISEDFCGDGLKAKIRYEHEVQGCEVAKRVLPAWATPMSSLQKSQPLSMAMIPGKKPTASKTP